MDLKHRLSTLRRQSGFTPDEPPMPGVMERLERYRRGGRSGCAGRIGAEALAATLGGAVLEDGVILIERRIGLDESHGRIPLARLLEDYDPLPDARGRDPRQFLFLDTETSGLAGGTGTVVFLLGLARIEGQALVVRQYHLTRFGAEGAMLSAAGDWLREAGCVVSYNGKCFDIPLLAARHRLCAVHDPLERLAHLDLLHATRRAFNRRWGDCRLVTAERKLLAFERCDDVPGAEAPEAWFAWVRRNDPGRLPGIARHNHWDVLSLAALVPALVDAHAQPGAWEADVAALARGLMARGEEQAARKLLAEHREMLDGDGLLALGRLHRRSGHWSAARAIWEPLAAEGCQQAMECLAKYHEHVARDPVRALDYALRLPAGAEQDVRRQRLRQKLGLQPAPALFR